MENLHITEKKNHFFAQIIGGRRPPIPNIGGHSPRLPPIVYATPMMTWNLRTSCVMLTMVWAPLIRHDLGHLANGRGFPGGKPGMDTSHPQDFFPAGDYRLVIGEGTQTWGLEMSPNQGVRDKEQHLILFVVFSLFFRLFTIRYAGLHV